MYVVYAYVCASFICYYCSQNERTLNLSANKYPTTAECALQTGCQLMSAEFGDKAETYREAIAGAAR